MRLAVVAWASVVLAMPAAASHADDDVDVPGRDSHELHGDALIWEDAALYLEPWHGGALVRFSTFGRGRLQEVGRAIPVRIVGAAMREFVEVELVDEPTCTWRQVTPDPRIDGLRLFVRRADLAPVLVKPFAMTNADGTSVRLAPGVPVMPTASGAYVVAPRGDAIRLAIPHGSVGFVYPRKRVDEPALPKGQLWRLDRAQPVALGDTRFDARAGWLAAKPDHHGDTVQLHWATRCIDLVVGVPARALRKTSRPTATGFLGVGGGGSAFAHAIARGTSLATMGGREVAVAAETIGVPPPRGGRACFDAQLVLGRLDERPPGRLARTFRLCVPGELVDGPPVDPDADDAATDPTATPADVAQPPRNARRTAKGVWWRRLAGTGRGRHPTERDAVVVHYTGWTTDGRMFDSSHKRGQPARFPLRAVIPGWTDGLQVMAVGDKVRLWIPEELAYKGRPGVPAGMLVFDVELLGIE